MINTTVLALDNVLASSVMGPIDIFCQTGKTYNYITGKDPVSYFDVKIVTKDGKPAESRNRPAIYPDDSIGDVHTADLIVVSSFDDYATVTSSRESIQWLREQSKKGAVIAGICAGTYILAETGLLDGKTATTHWGFADDFRRRYPQVVLRPEQIITDEGNLICSGGCSSYIDLSIYLVEKFCGREIALQSSKAILHDRGRNSQVPYVVCRFATAHNDREILKIQEWFEKNYNRAVIISKLAREFGLSRRVFERRFKAATGQTPLAYLQRLRVEMAKKMLETGRKSFSEISFLVGYEDASFFRRLFKKHTQLLPKQYREKFYRK